MAIKKFDYVEINYSGKTKDDNIIFDTTDEKVAKDNGLYNDQNTYKPVVICVGKRHVVKGLDDQLIGKDVGKFTIEVKDVDAFGKKSAKLLKLMPMKLFSEQDIKPFPGLDVNVDNQYGIVKNVSGGRVIVDFNHPLSSKDITYDVEVKRIVEDVSEKVKALLEMFHMPFGSVNVTDGKVVVETKQDIPKPFTDAVTKDIVETTGVKDVEFKMEEKKMEEEKKKEDVEETKEAAPEAAPEETTKTTEETTEEPEAETPEEDSEEEKKEKKEEDEPED
ncbi:MAG: peptidylprolyl isomerase [Nanoarchaeota archaeon]|nr:peptidylprolyl isomerase [Nanoarchaeota archaeon]